jgi:hypothetical protein
MEKYRINELFVSPATKDQALFASPKSDQIFVLPHLFVNLFLKCKDFKSMEEHARHIWRELSFSEKRTYMKPLIQAHFQKFEEVVIKPNLFPTLLAQILELHKETPLFLSETQLRKMSQNNAKKEINTDTKVTSVGIVTCDRPNNLKLGLVGFIKNAAEHKHSIRFVVCDDSRTQIQRDEYLKILTEIKENFPQQKIDYVGLKEKQVWIDSLSQMGVPADVIQFAIMGDREIGATYGANRNTLLLESAGEMFVSSDDDVLCEIAASPQMTSGVSLQSQKKTEYAVFESRQAALHSVKFENIDFLNMHNGILGRRLSDIISQTDSLSTIHTEYMESNMLHPIRHGRAKVWATFPGIVGDSGSNSNHFYHFFEDENLKRLTESKEKFERSMLSREVYRHAKQLTIEPARSCMTTILGLDNRDVLPPFFPIFRNEDAIFAHLLGLLHDGALFAHLPWLFHHSPPDVRKALSAAVVDPSFGLEEALRTVLKSFSLNTSWTDLSEKYMAAGDHILRFMSMPRDEIKEYFRCNFWQSQAESILVYESAIEKNKKKAPRYFLEDLKKIRDKKKSVLGKVIPLVDESLIEKFGLESAEQKNMELIIKYGELLKWWPDIIKKAKLIRKKNA